MNDLQRGYAAGLIDGEGCMRWHGGPEIQVDSCYPGTVRLLRVLFGGRVSGPYQRKSRKGFGRFKMVWRWTVRNGDCIMAITDLLPTLREKSAQARLLLQMYESDRSEIRALTRALRDLKRISYHA